MSLAVSRPQRLSCPDCLVARHGMLSAILGTSSGPCLLHSLTLDARADLPSSWFERYAFAVVRRGVVVRQRVEPDGERVAIDAAGPGSLLPLRMAPGAGSSTGYAASRVIVCVYPHEELELAGVGEATLGDLLRLQQQALERLERIAAARGRASAVEQVLALLDALLESIAPLRDGEPKPIDLTQRDMALLLRLRPETVCRALRTLEQQGAIMRTSSGFTVAAGA
jgi:CRP-like cAMP-binding protein